MKLEAIAKNEKIPFLLNSQAKLSGTAKTAQIYQAEFIQKHCTDESYGARKLLTIARFLKNEVTPRWLVENEMAGGQSYESGNVLVGRWNQHPYGGLVVRVELNTEQLVLANRLDVQNIGMRPEWLDTPAVWSYDWDYDKNGEEVFDEGPECRMTAHSVGLSSAQVEIAKGLCRGLNRTLEYYKTHDPR